MQHEHRGRRTCTRVPHCSPKPLRVEEPATTNDAMGHAAGAQRHDNLHDNTPMQPVGSASKSLQLLIRPGVFTEGTVARYHLNADALSSSKRLRIVQSAAAQGPQRVEESATAHDATSHATGHSGRATCTTAPQCSLKPLRVGESAATQGVTCMQ